MKSIDFEILLNHFTGISSESENKRLAAWIAESEENRNSYNRLKSVWFEHRSAFPKLDTEKALKIVLSRIDQTASDKERPMLPHTQSGKRLPDYTSLINSPIFRIAAVLIVLIGSFSVYRMITMNEESARVTLSATTLQTLTLSDGSRITVDTGTLLKYPSDFGSADVREVTLQGEAYFEVARSAGRPFIVHANGGTIEVLGTTFAIRAWEAPRNIVVAVREGIVSFQREGNTDTAAVVLLTRDRMSVLQPGKLPTPPKEIEFSRFISWMNREQYFQDTPVQEVLQQLERWYSVHIMAVDSSLYRNRITIFIENKPLQDNLQVLSVLLGSTYKQQGDTIRIQSQ